jgi:hypothetical protein
VTISLKKKILVSVPRWKKSGAFLAAADLKMNQGDL